MKALFKDKFGFSYYEYMILAQSLWFSFTLGLSVFDKQRFMTGIYRKYYKHIKQYLTITREEYNDLFLKTGHSIEKCVYSLRPSYSYPFIEYDEKIYFPTPHLIFQSVTTSMLYRLTENNNLLRIKIGKNVFEGYIEMISRNSGLFDEIYPEQVYNVGKEEFRTLDLLTRVKDTFILIDSKSFTPKSALRLFSEKAYNDDINRLAEAVSQVYYHLTSRFRKQYFPFKYDSDLVQDANVFGIVIVQDEPHFFMESIYKKAKNLIEKTGVIVDEELLIKHIGLLSVYDYERIVFCKNDIVDLLHRRAVNSFHNFDLNFEDIIKDDCFLQFRDKLLHDSLEFSKSIYNNV